CARSGVYYYGSSPFDYW
nr:immunoglobulin heavy chain junction region [Mus musculus]MBK4196936.1 immunoglobulin heavy chain junction region [Mus musculus]MBK4196937.1 immunoglobulin heavy chain junction region [Mus musculus]MBK4196938.1 immunoglobulin heavy chain junction region [Mus musculus]MBK4196939.1 immunoglobulin heavy chain junction region [Mus musculus]